jgi:hypothetical protein
MFHEFNATVLFQSEQEACLHFRKLQKLTGAFTQIQYCKSGYALSSILKCDTG